MFINHSTETIISFQLASLAEFYKNELEVRQFKGWAPWIKELESELIFRGEIFTPVPM